MDKRYNPNELEPNIYSLWEKSGYFNPDKLPDSKKRKPFTIVLPPPNASGKMHTGNVLMIAIEDLLIRWKRMQGYAALWIPGTDHAGFETQITFERQLKKEGKSRFDFDRKTLYDKIWEFVHKNKKDIEEQIKSMGASVDWTRYTFTLDDHVIKTVHGTFKKMHDDELIYRDDYMVNYCPKCGTTFADLEVKYVERKDPLYYMTYGPFTLATVRPETKFGDTAVAVHPTDKRYKKYIGKEIEVEGLLGKVKLTVIGDSYVDPEFGTGVVKVTPAHDKNDYEAGKRHNLEIKRVIDLNGRLNERAGKYAGLTVFSARKQVAEDLEKKGLLVKVDKEYTHTVATCYKGGHDIEPMIVPNWFVRVDKKGKSFKMPALDAVKKGTVTIYPKWREKTYIRWMEEMHDWPISRQIVWGIRIPVWYDVEKNPNIIVTFLPNHPNLPDHPKSTATGTISDLLKKYPLDEIESGLQNLFAPAGAPYVVSPEKPKTGTFLPETDTFDTWFSSGQWPLVTLNYPDSENFKRFYPTDVLETGWEIIRLWVSRMIMFGIYLTKQPPFHSVYLHGIVRATDGRKMSKSLGNVINPDEYQKEYGTDALRMGLISGTANGKDFNFPRDRIVGYRNFANKLWNIARFLEMQKTQHNLSKTVFSELKRQSLLEKEDKAILKKLDSLTKKVTAELEKYRFAQAAEDIYHFVWDEFASVYIENMKNREDKEDAIRTSYLVLRTSLKLLHPFMPFVTEAIWQQLPKEMKEEELLIVSKWPK
ncbi:MAG: valine--tRNA ligase [Candidatus Roizmanbacteria bacterium]|nr:valine--tRNA ligase [Candidatus Roizmanbacteria bacterium]